MSRLILVVDDEPDVETLFSRQLRKKLRAARFEMAFGRSAGQALERVDAEPGGERILILSDIDTPGMSGLDLPAVMLAAHGDEETRGKAAEAGAWGPYAKPIAFPEVRGESGRVLGGAGET